MKTIKVQITGFTPRALQDGREGDVFRFFIHGLRYSPELRANPPRFRLLEDSHHPHVLAQILDPWPDAPEYWPPESAPPPPKSAAAQGRNA